MDRVTGGECVSKGTLPGDFDVVAPDMALQQTRR